MKTAISILTVSLLFLSFETVNAQAQSIYTNVNYYANPPMPNTNLDRVQGRKGFQVCFYRSTDDASVEITAPAGAVTFSVSGAAKTVQANTLNPSSGNVGYQVVGGFDNPPDTANNCIEIVYNGEFASGDSISLTINGLSSVVGNLPQDHPYTLTYTAGTSLLRSPASIELVFDISGSMGWWAVPGCSAGDPQCVKRMDALKFAAQSFFGTLTSYAMLGDKLGAVYFSTTATAFDPTPGGSNLEPAHDDAKVNAINTNLQSKLPTYSTSIGAGLQVANTSGFGADTTPNPTKYILLFSDGEQNTPPLVSVSGSTIQVGGVNYPSGIKICPITAGRLSAPGFALQQSIADASCSGQNAHVRDDQKTFVQSDLETFFSQALSTFLVGDKLELARDATGTVMRGVSTKQKFLANTNDVALSILLSWSGVEQANERDFLPFRLKAPDGTVINLGQSTKIGKNMSYTTIHFPLRQGGAVIAQKGEWEIELLGSEIRSPELNYHLIVMLDNSTIATDYRIEAVDIGTGEAIPIRVKVTESGAPVHGATVIAHLVGPKDGLGNILSTTAPSGTPNPGADPLRSAAQGKLLLLMNDPAYANLFKNKSLPSLALLDNGDLGNADAAPGDGVYSGLLIGPKQEGHYHFMVTVQGSSTTNGDFQRTRRLTVFVRPKADADATEISVISSVVQPDGSVVVRLRITPRDAYRNYLGPDYLDHMKVRCVDATTTHGECPVAAPLDDKLNGSYEITYRLPSTASNPSISLDIMGKHVVTKKLSDIMTDKWVFSLHTGVTMPYGALARTYDGSSSFGIDLEYRFKDPLSLEVYAGHDRFDAKSGDDDFYFTHVSALGKLAYGSGMLRTSVFGGAGAYFAKGGNTYFGMNAGVSMQYWFRSKWAVEASYTYRNVNGGNFDYSTVQAGLRYSF